MKITITPKSKNKSNSKVKVGQLYKRIYTDDSADDYYTTRIFIVVDILDDKFSLVELNDGVSWNSATYDIDSLLSSDNFELLENVDITISV